MAKNHETVRLSRSVAIGLFGASFAILGVLGPARTCYAIDCNSNGVEDTIDIAGGTSADCNSNSIPDECEIASGTSADCNSNGIPDDCDVVLGGVAPMQVAKLTAADAAADDQFGLSVSISGDTAVIGASLDDDGGSNSGSAYVFREIGGNWQEIAKLTADDAAADDLFGWNVSISGDMAVIGAYQNDDGGSNSGSAYVFRDIGGNWQQIAKLTAADPAAGDFFGWSVSISGDTAVVGARFDQDGGPDSGSAYVFREIGGNWQEIAKLTASDAATGDRFGTSVSLSGETAVIGADQDDDGGSNSGSAYVFREIGGNWQQIAKLTAADAAVDDRFGRSVSLSGNTAVIGASEDNDGGSDSGSAYVYREIDGIWQQIAKLTAADAMADDRFSIGLSLSGETAVIGAYLDGDGGSLVGSAYVFNLARDASDCNGNGIPDECESLIPPWAVAVDDDAPAGGDGASWQTAYSKLQDALSAAGASGGTITEVWVAAGSYRPDETDAVPSGTGIRSATFQMIEGVSIYGGFTCGDDVLTDRDPINNMTILSGDLARNDGINFSGYGENSYHVVTGSGTDATAVLDGFTITGGNANGLTGTNERNGGGMLNVNGSPTVRNCRFVANQTALVTEGRGGAIFNSGSSPVFDACAFENNRSQNAGAVRNAFASSPRFTACTFADNTAEAGGALQNTDPGANTIIEACTFTGNTAPSSGGGAIHLHNGASATVIGSEFVGNSGQEGGAIWNWSHAAGTPSVATISGCTFVGNSSTVNGGAMHSIDSTFAIAHSEFRQNEAGGQGGAVFGRFAGVSSIADSVFVNCFSPGSGGAIHAREETDLRVSDSIFASNSTFTEGGAVEMFAGSDCQFERCVFVDNYSNAAFPLGGGAIHNAASRLNVSSCRFLGNEAAGDGGAIRAEIGTFNVLTTSEFVGNISGEHGGALNLSNSATGGVAHVVGCTMARNLSGNGAGGAVHVGGTETVNVTNSILWGNANAPNAAIYVSGGIANVSFTDHDGVTGPGTINLGSGNIGTDPQFVGGLSGTWTADATTHGLGKTIVFDAAANGGQGFVENELVGKLLNPNSSGFRESLITSNGSNTIVVWGDFTDVGTSGAAYRINDYSLDELSPAIDAGTNGVVGCETEPVGYWALDEGAGTTASDSSSNGLDGTLVGAGVSWIPGVVGYGLEFDNTLDHVEIPHSPILNVSDSFSVSFWIKADRALQGLTNDGISAVLDKSHQFEGGFNGWVVNTRAAEPGSISFAVGTGTAFPEPRVAGVIDNTWHHVTLTATVVPFLTMRGYVDGMLGGPLAAFSDPATTTLSNNTGSLFFGRIGGGGQTAATSREFQGMLDDVRIYPVRLDEVAILNLRNGCLDLDGNDRVVDVPWIPLPPEPADPVARVDMGAYEHQPDCNTNGVRDDIEMADGAEDCNSNSVPDVCDISLGLSSDIDSDGEPDDCDDPQFFCNWTGAGGNTSWDTPANWLPTRRPNNLPGNNPPEIYHATIGPATAFTVAGPAPSATIETFAIGANTGISGLNLATTLTVNQQANINAGGRISLTANNATLDGGKVVIATGGQLRTNGAGGDVMRVLADVENSGEIRIGLAQTLNALGSAFSNGPDGTITVLTNADLFVDSPSVSQSGTITASGGAGVLINSAQLVNSNGAVIDLVGATLACPDGILNQAGGLISGVGGQVDADIENEGVIEFEGTLTINGDLTALPGGVVTASGSFNITGTIHDFTAAGGTIMLSAGGGSGQLSGRSLIISDFGLVTVEGASDITLTADIAVSAMGQFAPSGPTDAMVSAINVIVGSPTGAGGSLILDHDISLAAISISVAQFGCSCCGLRGCVEPRIQAAGNASISAQDLTLSNHGTVDLEGASSADFLGLVSVDLGAVLSVLDGAELLVQGNLSIGSNGSLVLASSQPAVLGGDFVHQSTDPSLFNALNGRLLLDGSIQQNYEVAGTDLGPLPAGLNLNFAIGELEIAAGADVRFVDAFDNNASGQTPCTEALYVQTLVLRDGSSIELDSVRLYYGTLIDEGGSVSTNGCGEIVAIVTGDIDNNGIVNGDDYAAHAECLGGPNSAPNPNMPLTTQECLDTFDFDRDGDVDLADSVTLMIMFEQSP